MTRLLFTSLWLASQAVAFNAPTPVIKAVTTTAAAGYSACVTAEAYIDYCSSHIPNFANAPDTSIARCLCCSSTAYSPGLWDGVAATCASYIHTALPASTSEYTIFSALASFCIVEGNVCGGGAVTLATSSASAVATTTASTAKSSSSSSTRKVTSTSAQAGQSIGGTTSKPTSTTTTSGPATSTVTVPAASTSKAAATNLGGKDSLIFGVMAPIVAMFVL